MSESKALGEGGQKTYLLLIQSLNSKHQILYPHDLMRINLNLYNINPELYLNPRSAIVDDESHRAL